MWFTVTYMNNSVIRSCPSLRMGSGTLLLPIVPTRLSPDTKMQGQRDNTKECIPHRLAPKVHGQ